MSQAVTVNPYYLGIHPKTSVWTYFGISLGVFMFVLSSPHIIMRLFTTKNVNQGCVVVHTAGLSLVFHLLGYIGVAAAALVIEPKLANVDNTYIVVMDKLFSPFLRGLALAAILAAIMSTTSGMLLAVGGVFEQHLSKIHQSSCSGGPGNSHGQGLHLLYWSPYHNFGHFSDQIHRCNCRASGGRHRIQFRCSSLGRDMVEESQCAGRIPECSGRVHHIRVVHFSNIVPMFAEILISLPASALFMVIGSLVSAPPSTETIQFMESLHQSKTTMDQGVPAGSAA